ncbi:MAG: NusG domain II-containing protein [Ruminococcaceae bacterium]|nr:NusG domain II-containing protein [Oscillospiraceae bacterium]
MKRKLFSKVDLIIISVLLAVSLAFLLPRFFKKENLKAEIFQKGEKLYTIELSQVTESYELKLDGAVILVEKNAVSFKKADCPDKLCVKCGVLSHSGDTAVCVPTATVITVSGGSNEIDVISY